MKKKHNLVDSDGNKLRHEKTKPTTRTLERRKEDSEYIPVIIKRTDEAVRHPDDTLEKGIEEGLEQYERSTASLLLSSISAGLIIGFAGMCVAIISQFIPSGENWLLNRLLIALVYPLGFIVCIMSGTQLFTEHTATAVYPVLDKKIKLSSLFKLLVIVLTGNFIGTFISSLLLYASDNVIMAAAGYVEVSHHLLDFNNTEVFISAILAGWLMAQGGWLVLATPPTSSQIICVYIVTFIIGLGGLHHSIAGSAEIFSGLLHSEHSNYLKSFNFLLFAVLGNLLGGSVFVGVLNYSHIKKTQ